MCGGTKEDLMEDEEAQNRSEDLKARFSIRSFQIDEIGKGMVVFQKVLCRLTVIKVKERELRLTRLGFTVDYLLHRAVMIDPQIRIDKPFLRSGLQ